jgi:hypothetical protein
MDLSRLLALRTLTNALAEHFAGQARDYLANLGQLFQPRILLGDLIRYEKCAVKGQEAAFQELLKRYQPLARPTALNVQAELKPPLDCYGGALELFPASYPYTPEGATKPVTIVSPLKWILGFKDQGPARLRELIAMHTRSGGNDLQTCALHFIAMQLLAERRPGPAPLLDALRFPLSAAPQPDLGGIPFVFLCAPLPSVRPPDLLILQTTQISGTATFEEVVDAERIAELNDPIRERVLALVTEHGGDLKQELGL